MEKNFYNIFKAFFKTGTILLGGGYVILPILTSELVEKRKWLTSDELVEFYSVASSLPGIIAINTAIFTGRKLCKTKGAIAATSGMILPAFTAIILLASIINEITGKQFIHNMFWGIGIGIITLLFLAVCEMWKKSVNDKFSSVIYVACLILAISKKVPLYLIILGTLFVSILFLFTKKHKSKYCTEKESDGK